MAAGEGIETMLSLRSVLPALPLAAALSANHLAALLLPPGLRRLYIVRDNDPAGRRAAETLTARAQAAGIEALVLAPTLGDFNDDLRQLGPDALAAALRVQLAPEDVAPVLATAGARTDGHGERGAGTRIGMAAVSVCRSGWESRAHGLLRGRSDRKRPGPATAEAGYFPLPPPRASARTLGIPREAK